MGKMAKRRRRQFTAEYKAEVVRLVRTSGKSIGALATELQLTEGSVREWVKRADIDGTGDPNGPLTTEERTEMARLRRELRRVTEERDILKKATAFFAKGNS